MTTLREAATQALESLEDFGMKHYGNTGEVLHKDVYESLKAALAEEALQRLTDVSQEIEAALAEPDTCTWQQDGDSDSGVYGTSCGSYFNIEDGTPEDNKMRWCCYCGKKLAQSLITEDEDE